MDAITALTTAERAYRRLVRKTELAAGQLPKQARRGRRSPRRLPPLRGTMGKPPRRVPRRTRGREAGREEGREEDVVGKEEIRAEREKLRARAGKAKANAEAAYKTECHELTQNVRLFTMQMAEERALDQAIRDDATRRRREAVRSRREKERMDRFLASRHKARLRLRATLAKIDAALDLQRKALADRVADRKRQAERKRQEARQEAAIVRAHQRAATVAPGVGPHPLDIPLLATLTAQAAHGRAAALTRYDAHNKAYALYVQTEAWRSPKPRAERDAAVMNAKLKAIAPDAHLHVQAEPTSTQTGPVPVDEINLVPNMEGVNEETLLNILDAQSAAGASALLITPGPIPSLSAHHARHLMASLPDPNKGWDDPLP